MVLECEMTTLEGYSMASDELLEPHQRDEQRQPLLTAGADGMAGGKGAQQWKKRPAAVRLARIESYSYEPPDSAVWEAKRSQSTAAQARRISTLRWLYILAIGISTALVALGVTYAASQLSEVKFGLMNTLIARESAGLAPRGSALAWFVCISVLFASLASALVVLIEPVAAGSGIPEIKTILNGVVLPRVLRFRTLVCKAIGNALAVASGLPVGKEGPMIHSGAILAAGITQGSSTLFGWPSRWTIVEEFRNDKEKRDFISCGAAAGVAAAFGAPIGGLLFAIEEGTSHWFRGLVWRIFFCSIVTAFTLDFFLSGINSSTDGGWGVLDGNFMLSFGSFASSGQTKSWELYELPLFLLLGALGGLVGAAFNGLNKRISLWRRVHVPPSSPLRRWLEVVAITAVHSVLKFTISYTFGTCQQRPAADPLLPYSGDLQSFYCDQDEYNDLASMFMVPAEDAIRQLFHFPAMSAFSLLHLVIFFVTYISMAIITYGIAVPSGLFIPALLVGSAMGRFVGTIASLALPAGSLVDPGIYAYIGAASVLGGTTRMTVSLAVILLECTGNWTYGLPIMVALLSSRWMGNLFNLGIYDLHIDLRGWPLLPDGIPSFSPALELRVCDIMAKPPLALEEVEEAGTALAALTATQHNAFPVVFSSTMMDAHPRLGTLAGIVARRHLAVILFRKAFHSEPPTQPFALLPNPTTSLAAAYAISVLEAGGGPPPDPRGSPQPGVHREPSGGSFGGGAVAVGGHKRPLSGSGRSANSSPMLSPAPAPKAALTALPLLLAAEDTERPQQVAMTQSGWDAGAAPSSRDTAAGAAVAPTHLRAPATTGVTSSSRYTAATSSRVTRVEDGLGVSAMEAQLRMTYPHVAAAPGWQPPSFGSPSSGSVTAAPKGLPRVPSLHVLVSDVNFGEAPLGHQSSSSHHRRAGSPPGDGGGALGTGPPLQLQQREQYPGVRSRSRSSSNIPSAADGAGGPFSSASGGPSSAAWGNPRLPRAVSFAVPFDEEGRSLMPELSPPSSSSGGGDRADPRSPWGSAGGGSGGAGPWGASALGRGFGSSPSESNQLLPPQKPSPGSTSAGQRSAGRSGGPFPAATTLQRGFSAMSGRRSRLGTGGFTSLDGGGSYALGSSPTASSSATAGHSPNPAQPHHHQHEGGAPGGGEGGPGPWGPTVRLRMPSVPSMHIMNMPESVRNALPLPTPPPSRMNRSNSPTHASGVLSPSPTGSYVHPQQQQPQQRFSPTGDGGGMAGGGTFPSPPQLGQQLQQQSGGFFFASPAGAALLASTAEPQHHQPGGSAAQAGQPSSAQWPTGGSGSSPGQGGPAAASGQGAPPDSMQFVADGDVLELLYTDEPLLRYEDLEGSYPHYPDAADISLSEEEQHQFIDLRPYLMPCPFTIHVHAPVERAFELFRSLGLRHLVVVNDCHDVVGMITRHELVEAHLEECVARRRARRAGID